MPAKKTKTVKMPSLAEASKVAESQNVDIEQSREIVEKFTIDGQGDLKFAVTATAEVKDKLNKVEAKKKEFTDPLRQVIKDLEAFFDPALKGLKQCEVVLKDKIAAYNDQCIDKRADLLGQVEEAEDDDREALIADADQYIVDKVPGLALRENWKCEVFDADELMQWAIANDRLDLLKPDDKAIRAAVKASKGAHGIPGLYVEHDTTVAITVDRVER